MAIARTANTPCRHGPGCPHDIGPAAAAVDGLTAASRLQAFGAAAGPEDTTAAVGVGPVERRLETPAERAERELRDARERHVEALHTAIAARPGAIPAHVMRQPASRAKATAPADPEEETMASLGAPAPALPCADCLHAHVCALKTRAEDVIAEMNATNRELQPGLRLRVSASVTCDHHMTALAPLIPMRAAVPEGTGALASTPSGTAAQGVPLSGLQTPDQVQASRVRGGMARRAQVEAGKARAQRIISPEGREAMRLNGIARGEARRAEAAARREARP